MINQEKQDRKKQKTSKGTDGGKKKKISTGLAFGTV